MQALANRLAQGDGVIDVGANVGHVTERVAKAVGPTGAVLAVEPNPVAHARIATLAQRYPWVTAMNVAVDDAEGEREFFCGPETIHGSFAAVNVPRHPVAMSVRTVTLPTLAAMVPRLRAIKIDAQGAEGRILAAADALLARTDLLWVIEAWPAGLLACGSSLRALVARFAESGWSVLAVGKQLEGPGQSWAAFEQRASAWRGHGHTNVLIGRG